MFTRLYLLLIGHLFNPVTPRLSGFDIVLAMNHGS